MGKSHCRMPHKVTYITLPSLSRLLIVVLILCLHHMHNGLLLAQDGDGACDVPSVEPLASTSLTCHFNEDLKETKSRFDVYLNKGVRQQNAHHVLGCQWISDNISCFVSPGYKLNNVVSRKVTLEIPRASQEQIGTYTCVTDNINRNKRKSCDFRVTLAGKTMCDVPSVRLNTPTSLTCYFPEDISKTKADYAVYHYKNSDNPDHVLSYRWSKKSLKIIAGYLLDGNVTDHLTLRIPSAVEDQEGKYSCHITGVDLGQNCSFMLEKVAPTTSTCNISSVQETEPAELTCAFSVDVNVTRKDFKVVRIGGKEIAICRWRNNDLRCSKSVGYEINETVTDHFVIKVIAASSEHKGKYACQIMDAEMDCFEPCEFNVLMTAKSTGEHESTAAVVLPSILSIAGTVFGFVIATAIFILRRRCTEGHTPAEYRRNKYRTMATWRSI